MSAAMSIAALLAGVEVERNGACWLIVTTADVCSGYASVRIQDNGEPRSLLE
jgi:hypothetical protein